MDNIENVPLLEYAVLHQFIIKINNNSSCYNANTQWELFRHFQLDTRRNKCLEDCALTL